jgi:hypothetical protein
MTPAKDTDLMMDDNKDDHMATIASALIEINETLQGLLALLQEREAAFQKRKASFGDDDRKPFRRDNNRGGDDKPYRKSYERNDRDDGDRKPYRPAGGGDRKPFGDKKPFGAKKPFGDKKPYSRSGGDDDKPRARKTYKGGY